MTATGEVVRQLGDVRRDASRLASMPLSAINGNPWVARPYF